MERTAGRRGGPSKAKVPDSESRESWMRRIRVSDFSEIERALAKFFHRDVARPNRGSACEVWVGGKLCCRVYGEEHELSVGHAEAERKRRRYGG